MSEMKKWYSVSFDDGTVLRVRKLYWREQDKAGKWQDSNRLAVEIQRIKEGIEGLKVDIDEARVLIDLLKEVQLIE